VLVAREVGDLWRTGDWHSAWFERACRDKIDEALRPLSEEWQARACALEILHLKNPHLSLRLLLVSGGDPSLALTFERGEQVIATAQRGPDGLEVADSGVFSGAPPVRPIAAARRAAGEQSASAAEASVLSSGSRDTALQPRHATAPAPERSSVSSRRRSQIRSANPEANR
jgi:hypothetical protein